MSLLLPIPEFPEALVQDLFRLGLLASVFFTVIRAGKAVVSGSARPRSGGAGAWKRLVGDATE